MCIICYHEEGKPMPTEKHMDICWTNNPDGAGLAVWREEENVWEVRKGFMEREEFTKAYAEMDFKKEDLFILHWRVATSGKVDAKRTHPFPVTDRCDNMLKLEYKRKKIVFHNGIVGAGTKEHSDTMIGIRDYIDPLWKYLGDDKIYYMLEDLWSPGRLLICDGDRIAELGTWIKGDGLMWSNDGYEKDRWAAWNKAAAERRENYGKSTTITKETSAFALDWESPYRNPVTGDFDWTKFEAASKGEDSWEEWDMVEMVEMVDAAETVAPSDYADTVIAMIDSDDGVHMDASYHEEQVTKEFLMCPHCYEERYINDTPFNVGDSICMICGCVFDDATGEEVYFDPDMHAGYLDHQREVANG